MKKESAGEQTPIFHNRPNEAFKKERGVHDHTPQGTLECLRYIGAGNSPTLEYDRYVVSEALNYLKMIMKFHSSFVWEHMDHIIRM